MRKVISLIVFGAFCVALFSSPAQARNHDPKKPLLLQEQVSHRDGGDDGGWDDVEYAPNPSDFDSNLHFQLLGVWSLTESVRGFMIRILGALDDRRPTDDARNKAN